MRPLPGTRSRRSRSLAAAAVLALTCTLVVPSAGADDLRDREKKAKSEVRDAYLGHAA